jgi:dinuclear metal center YbgI/SA1388 family protein
MPKIKELTNYLEQIAPLAYQESYDNSGLLVGDANTEISGVLVSLDCTEEVVEEALARNCNLIVAHHPIIFKGLKKLNGKNYVERTVIKAIKNVDNVVGGVNFKIAQMLDLQQVRVLSPKNQVLTKMVVFVPIDATQNLLDKLYEAGAGNIGNYNKCSFRVEGKGTFCPNEVAKPAIGESNKEEEVCENRVEVIFPTYLQNKVLAAMREGHPYEEIAHYLTLLDNQNHEVGSGAIGELPQAMNEMNFLHYLNEKMQLSVIKYTALLGKPIKRVAVCGGVGSFLLGDAIANQADIFITADYKYHEFFDADNRIIIADIGHYESEHFTKELLVAYISKKFINFATYLSEVNTNPVKYFSHKL